MTFKKNDVVITSAARTAIGTYRGSLKNIQAYELGSVVVKEVMEKSNLNSMRQYFRQKQEIDKELEKIILPASESLL